MKKTNTKTVADHPVLVSMWMDKNQLHPTEAPLYSRDKAWWQCPTCHFQFERVIAYHSKKEGACPRCLIAKSNQTKHLGITHPDIAKTLISDKNEGWEAIHLTASSNRKLWWKCETCHREYETRVSERVKTHRCGYCSKRKVSSLNALSSVNPSLAKEWHPTLNGDVTPDEVAVNSNRIFWWKCLDCGHSWKCACKTRNLQQSKCPACEKKRRENLEFYIKKDIEKSLFKKFPQICHQWHSEKNTPLLPTQVGKYSKKEVWWRCDACQHEWVDSIVNRTRTVKGRKCPSCQKDFLDEKGGILCE